MTKPVETLDDATLAQVEAEIANRNDATAMESACGEYNCPCHYKLPALCRTVKQLRTEKREHERLLELANKYSVEVGEAIRNLQSQLEQLRAENERLNAIVSAYENQDEEALAEACENP